MSNKSTNACHLNYSSQMCVKCNQININVTLIDSKGEGNIYIDLLFPLNATQFTNWCIIIFHQIIIMKLKHKHHEVLQV